MENMIRKPSLKRTSSEDPNKDLFGFEAARARQEEQLAIQQAQLDSNPFTRHRVFINHVDSYVGKKLAETFSELVYVNPESNFEDTDQNEGNEELQGEDAELDEDIGDEMGNEGERRTTSRAGELERKYEVIGTALDRNYVPTEDVSRVIKHPGDQDTCACEDLVNCGFIIYDITQDPGQIDEAQWALEAIAQELECKAEKSPKAFEREAEVRYFILISTIMTWALTKPLDPEDPDLPITEEDYRKRKPHPNFKRHIQLEKDVVAIRRRPIVSKKLKTLVICSGILYGEENVTLRYLFKMAWLNAQYLPIFGRGNNRIPLLHVRDLVTVLITVLREWPPLRYIVAVEQERASQSIIVRAISGALTTGKVKRIAKEEAFLLPEVTQDIYDAMTINLNIDPVYVADRISWHFELPFRDSIGRIVKESRAALNLHPMKIIVLGPPASGKTRVAHYLAEHYQLPYIHVKSLITDTIQGLSNQMNAATSVDKQNQMEDKGAAGDEPDEDLEGVDVDEKEEEGEGDEEDTVRLEDLQEQLDEIRNNMAQNNGRLDDTTLNKLFLNRLRSRECQNQGYVIDGYPKTLVQAKQLFGAGATFDEEEDDDDVVDEETETDTLSGFNNSIMPELVVVLEASEEFLKERVISRPEKEVQHTHYTESHMMRRLKEYRERNTDDNTPLQFFDELEIHPLVIPIEDDACPDMFPTVYQCLKKLGKPRNYGPTPQETAAAEKEAEARARVAVAAEKSREEREMQECRKQRREKMMKWAKLQEKLTEEEEERLCISGLPLRRYLVNYVFPTLTQGLIEVAKLRPDDPVDFLAEYLFKENPEGKMFEPDYTETMSMLLDAIEQMQQDILPVDELEYDFDDIRKCRQKLYGSEDEDVYDVCTDVKTTPPTSEPSFDYEGREDALEDIPRRNTSDEMSERGSSDPNNH